MNIPNSLSVFRILLVPVFVWVYLTGQTDAYFYIAAAVLVVSGLTDKLDGLIARRYNMITELGRFLDPFADKLTQAAVVVCLAVRFPAVTWLAALFIAKEAAMALGAVFLTKEKIKIASAQWYGKFYTFAFYVSMTLVVAFTPRLSAKWVFVILAALAAPMLFSFIMYIPVFLSLNRKKED